MTSSEQLRVGVDRDQLKVVGILFNLGRFLVDVVVGRQGPPRKCLRFRHNDGMFSRDDVGPEGRVVVQDSVVAQLIGICFTCVARVKDPGGGWDYKRTCIEGPVFAGASIEWA